MTMRTHLSAFSRIALAATVAALAGCNGGSADTPTASTTGGGGTPPPPPMAGEAPPPPPASGGEQVKLRRTIGETTTDVRDFDTEMQSGENVQVSTGKITARDPITIQGNAYVSIVGQASVLQIQQSVNIFNALHDRYPADTEEFMREIIQANNIRLPQLPAYQEYAYDSNENRLVVLEYPDRMETLRNQVRGGNP